MAKEGHIHENTGHPCEEVGHHHEDKGHLHEEVGHHHEDKGHCCCHEGHQQGHHGESHHHDGDDHEHHGHQQGLWLIGVEALLLIAAIVVEKTWELTTFQLLLVYMVPYLLAGHETLREAAEGLVHGDAFNEHFLMSVATIGALCIGFMPGVEPEFAEAVFVMLFFQVGEFFEGYAEGQSRKSISHLLDLRPDVAYLERDGEVVEVSPEAVQKDDVIVIRPGGKIPLDGVVISGSSALNTVALTGESMPREVSVGDDVMSGCINGSSVLRVRVSKIYGESTVQKIIALVEHAGNKKSKSESFITRFARIYTPIVVVAALLLAFVPPLLSVGFSQAFPVWLGRALIFLVVSCPCALVISVPLTFFGGIGGASRKGILVKGANYIDVLSSLSAVVFDKTGTLTHGRFIVEAVHPESCDENRLLHLAAHVEHFSTHPIAAALREAFPDEATDGCSVEQVQEISGCGVCAVVGTEKVCVGNTKMMEHLGISWRECEHNGTIIHVAIDGMYAGHIVINDTPKPDSQKAVEDLKALGVSRIVMLTGDRKSVAQSVAARLGIDDYHAELLPADKVEILEQIKRDESEAGSVAFVGDGINDAPVLARADVGIAMGGLGSDAAIEAADVVLMDDHPSKIATAIRVARRTIAIARQNVWFAISVKVAVLILAAVGIASMWLAAFADVGVTVLAVLNAMRALR